ncbi:hypothetical protein GCM10025876_32260 [Demequina litorisediminis]|uniref:RimM N-terminal domain-containing protein n=1 Tax=Demequina litorisediminis TaxID=1849022 RepID=A0ABQ6IIN6_9MICO|nr:hypothetical protein GCM10025876_32260 [Demequina litorisediminis]
MFPGSRAGPQAPYPGHHEVTVARIGRAHGLKGEVSVEVRTDIPDERLIPGETYETQPSTAGPLTITNVRTQAGRWYLRFDEIADRDAAEAARGVELVIDGDESDEDDAWYVHEPGRSRGGAPRRHAGRRRRRPAQHARSRCAGRQGAGRAPRHDPVR